MVALRQALQMQPLQLQQAQQAVALQQQQVRDIQAGQAAYGEWDGKDYGELASLMIKNGSSVGAANQVAMYGLTMKQKLADIYKTGTEADRAAVETTQKRYDQIAGAINAVNQQPDSDIAQNALDTSQRLLNDKVIDPQMYQGVQQMAQQVQQGQMTPDQFRQKMGFQAKALTAESEAATNAQKYATAAYMQAQAPMKIAEAQDWETFHQTNPQVPYEQWVARNAAVKAGQEAQARLGPEMSLAAFNKQASLQNQLTEHGLNAVTNLFTGPQGYSQTLATLGATKDAVAKAQNGDQLAASLAPMMTALGVTSFAGIHRINQNEINAAGPQVGSILRRINAALDKAGTGKLAPGTAAEMSGLMDSLQTAKYNSILQSAGVAASNAKVDPSQVTVMDKNGNLTSLQKAQAGAAAQPAAAAPTGGANPAPEGTVVRGADGKNYIKKGGQWVPQQ
jgi:hypothetical protein